MTSFVNRCTQAPVCFAIEAAALIDFLLRTHNTLKIAFSRAFRNSNDNFRHARFARIRISGWLAVGRKEGLVHG
jgi:hypothetical protein